ncbi:MAG TPA: hypothetical protein VF092_27165 [Longimicrobium sp.]
MKRRGARRWLTGVAALTLLAGCSDDPAAVTEPGPRSRGPNRDDTGDAPAVRRIGLDLHASGSFRPGTPIVVTALAAARHAAGDVDFRIVAPDGEVAQPGDAVPPAATSRGAMGRGAQRQLTATITFPSAGYYRVVAQTRSQPPAGERSVVGDTAVVEESSEELYLLVDDGGGRVTAGYDPAVLAGSRLPLFGAFGPFVETRAHGAAPALAAVRAAAEPAHLVTSTSGFFRYYNNDTGTNRPVPNAEVSVTCLNSSYAPLNSFTVATAADGSFSFSCSSGIYDASISLRNRIAHVVSPGQANAGVSYFNEGNGANPSFTAANNYAAHAHVLLNQYVPVAESRFGLSRGRVPVIVHPTDSAFAINYNQTQDTIRLNYTRVFTEDGRFVTIHEYGHAYHWAAIEPWSNYYCSPNGEHYIDRQYQWSCAFVEGFATFFAVWVAGDALTSTYYSDYTIESQTFYSGKDGAQVEGAVAGFLYDFVDASSAPDGPSNQTGSDDSWDGVSYQGSFLANLIRSCTVTSGTTTLTAFDGIDLVVYCMEGNTTARLSAESLGYFSWYPADSVVRNATVPAGYSTDAVRRLWHRNFYGVA